MFDLFVFFTIDMLYTSISRNPLVFTGSLFCLFAQDCIHFSTRSGYFQVFLHIKSGFPFLGTRKIHLLLQSRREILRGRLCTLFFETVGKPDCLFLFQNSHELVAGNRFFLQQISSELIHFVTVFAQNAQRLFMGLFNQFHNLFIDL